MTPSSTVTIDVHLTAEEWNRELLQGCAAGLSATPRSLSPVWFYDDAGSELFDAITRLPEYYPTRTERTLLLAHAADVVDATGADTLVELGSGTSDKTRCLLDAMARAEQLDCYVPFDVSEQVVRVTADALVREYPGLDVHAVIGDFHHHLELVPRHGRRIVAFLGGTIGNFEPHDRAVFLRDVRENMGAKDHLLLGVDLVKDEDVLVRAYDDSAGVTARFNLNALANMNERLDANFDLDGFAHVALWNAQEEWIEMRLRATRAQTVSLPVLDMDIDLAEGEELRTEISAKFTPDRISSELVRAGFEVAEAWTASPGFMLLLARPIL